jgi:hypothetical protein
MTVRASSLMLFVLITISAAHANDDYNEIFERAVDAVDFEFDRSWAYTETRIDSEHVWVGRSDPRRPSSERWKLMTVDDREPTANEIEEYRKEKRHDHSGNGDRRVEAMVEPGSIRLIKETDEHWLFGFNPDDDDERVMDSVESTIRINKADGRLEYIDLRNHSPMKPAFGVRISKLITRLTFGPAADDGPVVPLSTQVEAKGRAYLFVSFDEQELYRNSDFVYVGEE